MLAHMIIKYDFEMQDSQPPKQDALNEGYSAGGKREEV